MRAHTLKSRGLLKMFIYPGITTLVKFLSRLYIDKRLNMQYLFSRVWFLSQWTEAHIFFKGLDYLKVMILNTDKESGRQFSHDYSVSELKAIYSSKGKTTSEWMIFCCPSSHPLTCVVCEHWNFTPQSKNDILFLAWLKHNCSCAHALWAKNSRFLDIITLCKIRQVVCASFLGTTDYTPLTWRLSNITN